MVIVGSWGGGHFLMGEVPLYVDWTRAREKGLAGGYRGTSLIKNTHLPPDRNRSLGIMLLQGPAGGGVLYKRYPCNGG